MRNIVALLVDNEKLRISELGFLNLDFVLDFTVFYVIPTSKMLKESVLLK